MAAAGSGDALKTSGIAPYPPRAAGSNSHTKICSLCCHLSSSPTGFCGKNKSWGFFIRDRGDSLPAAEGNTFGFEEQEDPGAEQRQIRV